MPDTPEQDPLIQEEERKYKLKLLRWNYYLNVTKSIGAILSVFRDEAISLVAGVVTLVTGFFEVKKIITSNGHRHMAPKTMNYEMRGSGRGEDVFESVIGSPTSSLLPEGWTFDYNTGLGSLSLFILVAFSLRSWFKRKTKNTPQV